jgi:hypothetical protein
MFLTRNFSQKEEQGWSSKLEIYKVVYKKLIGLGEND